MLCGWCWSLLYWWFFGHNQWDTWHRPGLALIMETCPYGSVLTCGCLRNPMKTSINLGWLKAELNNGDVYHLYYQLVQDFATIHSNWNCTPRPCADTVTELRSYGSWDTRRKSGWGWCLEGCYLVPSILRIIRIIIWLVVYIPLWKIWKSVGKDYLISYGK